MPHFDHFPCPAETDPYMYLLALVWPTNALSLKLLEEDVEKSALVH